MDYLVDLWVFMVIMVVLCRLSFASWFVLVWVARLRLAVSCLFLGFAVGI